MRLARTAALIGALLMLVVCAPAGATFRARNGQIAFKRYLDRFRTTSAIFVSSPSGKHQRQITHPTRGVQDEAPDWSPGGRSITFQRCAQLCEVWVVRSNGSGATRLGPDCLQALPQACESRVSPAFSPTGAIAFGRAHGDIQGGIFQFGDLDVMNTDGSGLRTIYQAPPYSASDAQFAWAPNGRRLVEAIANSSLATPPNAFAVYVINADGSGLRQITPFAMRAGDGPDWSPDGKRILFRSRADSTDPVGAQLYTAHPDGSGLHRITHFKRGTAVLSSSFSPDGRWITVALNGTGGQPDVYVMRTNGTGLRAVTRTRAWDSTPDWGPAH